MADRIFAICVSRLPADSGGLPGSWRSGRRAPVRRRRDTDAAASAWSVSSNVSANRARWPVPGPGRSPDQDGAAISPGAGDGAPSGHGRGAGSGDAVEEDFEASTSHLLERLRRAGGCCGWGRWIPSIRHISVAEVRKKPLKGAGEPPHRTPALMAGIDAVPYASASRRPPGSLLAWNNSPRHGFPRRRAGMRYGHPAR